MTFTDYDVVAMHGELAAICEHVHTLVLVEKIATSHRLDQIHHLRLKKSL